MYVYENMSELRARCGDRETALETLKDSYKFFIFFTAV